MDYLDHENYNRALQKLPKLNKPKHTCLSADGYLYKTGGYTKRQMREYALYVLAQYKAGILNDI